MNCIFGEPFWVKGTVSYILASIFPSSLFGKWLVARDMNILGSRVGLHIPNIGCVACIMGYQVYLGIWGYIRVDVGNMGVCGGIWEGTWRHMQLYAGI